MDLTWHFYLLTAAQIKMCFSNAHFESASYLFSPASIRKEKKSINFWKFLYGCMEISMIHDLFSLEKFPNTSENSFYSMKTLSTTFPNYFQTLWERFEWIIVSHFLLLNDTLWKCSWRISPHRLCEPLSAKAFNRRLAFLPIKTIVWLQTLISPFTNDFFWESHFPHNWALRVFLPSSTFVRTY